MKGGFFHLGLGLQQDLEYRVQDNWVVPRVERFDPSVGVEGGRGECGD